MRPLTLEELHAVSGGADVIVVTGTRPESDGGGYGWSYNFDNHWDPGDMDSADRDQSNGDDSPPEPSECQVDAGASDLADEMRAHPDYATNELAAVLYVNEFGDLAMTQVAVGTSSGFTLGLPSGVEASDVVGWVHTHPAEPLIDQDPNTPGVQDPTGELINDANRMPSEDDWAQFDRFVADGANPYELSLYVVGPDGVLREYNASNRSTYDLPNAGYAALEPARDEEAASCS